MQLILDEPLLTADDERDLARWIEAGAYATHLLDRAGTHPAGEAALRAVADRGQRARARFVRANLRLVAGEARAAARRCGLPEDELFQEGATGLVLAVDRFDHTQPVRFATYALPWIRAHVGRAVARRCGQLHLSRHGAEARRTALTIAGRLEDELCREPRVDEIARAMGRPVDTVRALLAHGEPRSLTGATGDELDRPDPGAEAGFIEVEDRLARAEVDLDELAPDERAVVALRYGLADARARTIGETARTLGLSASAVRRRERRALDRLRAGLERAEGWAA